MSGHLIARWQETRSNHQAVKDCSRDQRDEIGFPDRVFRVSLLTELAVLLVLRTHGQVLRGVPGRLLLWTTVAVVAFAVVVPYIGPFASVFGFVALPWPLLCAMGTIVVG